ncbi:toll-like receptor 6 [Ostrea edulis]|uniref:toll-like receptor 6 n=1 Tax=Ostrea edulis TaxID=37623 RepID=UPI0024AFA990|nr:toll-like receptor 6 [Ostrea edulis]
MKFVFSAAALTDFSGQTVKELHKAEMTVKKSNQSVTFTEHTTPPLPPGWEDFCTEKNLNTNVLAFKCNIDTSNSGRWNFEVLRDFIMYRRMKYKFDVECLNGANISLIWPAKAKNLKGMQVYNCIIEDFYNDCMHQVVTSFPDEMEFMNLTNVVIMTDIFEVLHLSRTIANVTQDCHCGNDESVITRIQSNVTYNFGDSLSRYYSLVGQDEDNYNNSKDPVPRDGQKMHNDMLKIEHICNYQKMQIYDYSINPHPSKFYINIKTERSWYPVLKMLNFSYTDISSISDLFDKLDEYFPKLESLDLSHCNIQTVEIRDDNRVSLRNGTVLKVNITHNNITELQVDSLERLIHKQNLFINFSHNPLNCSCTEDMKELIIFVKDSRKWSRPEYLPYNFIREMKCAYPKHLNRTRLIDLQESHLMCESDLALTKTVLVEAIVPLSIFAAVLLGIFVVFVRFRREIQILMYTRHNILLSCQQDETSEDKTFDAFVSYSNEDHEWVKRVFEDSVEGLKNFKFCLHHRDFMAGKTITENIINSIESSRHTIVIVSKNFLDSSYCLYEFEEALRQSISEKTRHLVVVMFEEISVNEMPKVLQACLKTFTYIRKDDAIFLDRLVYSLSCKHRQKKIDIA